MAHSTEVGSRPSRGYVLIWAFALAALAGQALMACVCLYFAALAFEASMGAFVEASGIMQLYLAMGALVTGWGATHARDIAVQRIREAAAKHEDPVSKSLGIASEIPFLAWVGAVLVMVSVPLWPISFSIIARRRRRLAKERDAAEERQMERLRSAIRAHRRAEGAENSVIDEEGSAI